VEASTTALGAHRHRDLQAALKDCNRASAAPNFCRCVDSRGLVNLKMRQAKTPSEIEPAQDNPRLHVVLTRGLRNQRNGSISEGNFRLPLLQVHKARLSSASTKFGRSRSACWQSFNAPQSPDDGARQQRVLKFQSFGSA